MCLTEFDEKTYIDGIRAESRRDDVIQMLKRNKSPEQIAEFCGYDLAYVKGIQEEIMHMQYD